MRGTGIRRGAALAAALALLAACEPVAAPPPPDPPARAVPPAARPLPVEPSARSRELSEYFGRVENDLVAQGLLRTDGGGPDVPFSKRQLVENFVRIALYEEFSNVGGLMMARQTESRLHRWEQPVRMRLEFGASVPRDQRVKDRNSVTSFARRLARVTGHPIAMSDAAPNFHVLIVNEEERRAIGPKLLQIVPNLSQGAIDTIRDIPRSTFCLVFAIDPADDGVYQTAVAVIRGEHPDLLRLSCIQEEMAQGLGLSNDSPAARPSIFNDDEEFGLLTTHDELLLKILYDPRMRPGMTVDQARPTANVIAAELLGGPV